MIFGCRGDKHWFEENVADFTSWFWCSQHSQAALLNDERERLSISHPTLTPSSTPPNISSLTFRQRPHTDTLGLQPSTYTTITKMTRFIAQLILLAAACFCVLSAPAHRPPAQRNVRVIEGHPKSSQLLNLRKDTKRPLDESTVPLANVLSRYGHGGFRDEDKDKDVTVCVKWCKKCTKVLGVRVCKTYPCSCWREWHESRTVCSRLGCVHVRNKL